MYCRLDTTVFYFSLLVYVPRLSEWPDTVHKSRSVFFIERGINLGRLEASVGLCCIPFFRYVFQACRPTTLPHVLRKA